MPDIKATRGSARPAPPFEIEASRSTDAWCVSGSMHRGRSVRSGRSRQRGGDRDYLVLEDERLTHVEHYARAVKLASALVETSASRRATGSRSRCETYPNGRSRSLRRLCCVAVPINAFWNGRELAFALADCEPKVLIADGERIERLRTSQPRSRESPWSALASTIGRRSLCRPGSCRSIRFSSGRRRLRNPDRSGRSHALLHVGHDEPSKGRARHTSSVCGHDRPQYGGSHDHETGTGCDRWRAACPVILVPCPSSMRPDVT